MALANILSRRRDLLRAGAVLSASQILSAERGPRLEIWHGLKHRVGHLGDAQDDFNLLGHVSPELDIERLTCSVNGGAATNLRFRKFRRIVTDGDFNADIPVRSLRPGLNRVVVDAVDRQGRRARAAVTLVVYKRGRSPLPAKIVWNSVRDPEDVGQYSDGRWVHTSAGLRTAQIGYDRVFLIGNRTWKDYEVTAPVTIHALSRKNGGQSGTVRHAGFCLRWAGHSTEDNAPGEQPKWGLHPRGGIVWLTVRDGQMPPVRQFWPGDSERFQTFDPFPIELGKPFWMKGRCETIAADSTRYSFKVWDTGRAEPRPWDFQVVQESAMALHAGGVALVAHELDVTFGDLMISGPAH